MLFSPGVASGSCWSEGEGFPCRLPTEGVSQDCENSVEELAGVRTPGPRAEAPGMRTGGPHSGNPSAVCWVSHTVGPHPPAGPCGRSALLPIWLDGYKPGG